jgi:LCP family protein required for cell wall assembly
MGFAPETGAERRADRTGVTAFREIPGVLLLNAGSAATSHAPGGGAPRRPRRPMRLMIGLLVLLLLLTSSAIIALLSMQSHLAGQLGRVDGVFADLENRPDKPSAGPAAEALNILVMGTDRRSDEPTTGTGATAREWVPGAQRTDTIMILHVDGDRDGASLISIPRDSWVDVPGYGYQKVNAAFSLAGPSLAVRTVENLTGIRIDHLAVVDWSGFRALIDVVGGVTVTVPRTIEDPHFDTVWTEGRRTLNGEQALLYSRQRYGLPRGDLDRVRRQQAVVRGLVRSSVATLRSAQPFEIYDLLDTLTENISVDSGWSFGELRSLVLDLRGLRPGAMDFLTVPVRGLGREGDQSVVYLDRAGNQTLWKAVRDDHVGRWASAHESDAVVGPVS